VQHEGNQLAKETCIGDEMMEILDVGCGYDKQGTIGIDLFFIMQRVHNDDPLKIIRLDVQADACHIPFKDKAFDVVHSAHCIEHIANPYMMLDEMASFSFSNGNNSRRCTHCLMYLLL
jgi:2-polyprenyl-3-methyl-5-hydroxy-6-metoxy-1,4-benzoquinol methylase